MELRLKTLKEKIKILKAKKKALKYSLALSTPIVKEPQATPSSLKVINGKKAVKPPPKSYAQIVVANAAQNTSKTA